MYDWSIKKLKRVIVAVTGLTTLVIGIAMIMLPGPAIVVIPLGLGILATEFIWARRLLCLVRERIQHYSNNRESSNEPNQKSMEKK